jgi:Uma2 family endonuclease
MNTLEPVKTVILGPVSPEVEALIAQRRRLGQDTHDEVWDGEYHMSPVSHGRHSVAEIQLQRALGTAADEAGLVGGGPFNLGTPDNYRVPDGGFHRSQALEMWNPTAAIVFEVLSPNDESFEKFPFYAQHGVEEIIIVDPIAHTVQWFIRDGDDYIESDRSTLLGVSPIEVAAAMRWSA